MEGTRPPEGLFRGADVLRLAKLLAGGMCAALIPFRFDEAVTCALLRVHSATQPAKTAELAAFMERTLALRRNGDWQGLAQEHARMTVEESWGRFRGIASRRWRPAIALSGEQHVRNALQGGRGAVFWCMRFASDTVAKQGFHQVGLPLVHLSSAEHGAWGSRTKLATSVISPFFSRAENPYLADRVIIPVSGSLSYLERVRDHLRKGVCVSIFGDRTGRQQLEMPFLTGSRKFATGAPSLAWAENCPLFSVYAIGTGPFQYRVVVEEPIPVDRSLARKEFVRRAVGEFAQRMERAVERHPSDWREWADWKRASRMETGAD
jgi:hypothetical protein